MNSHQEDINEDQTYFIEAVSTDGNWLVVFEDDGETGYLYFCSFDLVSKEYKILDHLWIYNKISPTIHECDKVSIYWSDDSSKVCLIVDGECWGIIDIKNRRKMSSPRDGLSIRSIERSIWDNGINQNQGEELIIVK